MMKIRFRLACLAALAAAATSGAQAQSSVTLYGRVDAGLELNNSGKGWNERLITNGLGGNRLGFTGQEDLGGGLSAIYRLEMGFNLDDGTLGQGGRAFGREAAVGFSSRQFGTLTFGRITSPSFNAHVAVDAFGYALASSAAINRNTTTTRSLNPFAANQRLDNSINYVTPELGGFEFRGIVAASERSETIGNAYDTSVRYRSGPLDVVLEYGQLKGSSLTPNSGKVRSIVAGGSYDFNFAKVFAGFTDEKNTCTTCTGALARMAGVTGTNASQFKLAQLGVRVPVGATTLIAQYVRVSDRSVYAAPTGDRDANWFALGADYRLSKRTVLYTSIATIENKNGSNYALGTGTASQPAGVVGTGNPRSTTFSVGMNHSF